MQPRLCSRYNEYVFTARARIDTVRALFAFFSENLLSCRRREMNKLKKEKTKYPFHKNMLYLLGQARARGKEWHSKISLIIVFSILPKVLTPLAATFLLKAMIDCVDGKTNGKVLPAVFAVYFIISLILAVTEKFSERQRSIFNSRWRYSFCKNIIRKTLTVEYEKIENYDSRKSFTNALSGVGNGSRGLTIFLDYFIEMGTALTGIAAFFSLAALSNVWIVFACLISGVITFLLSGLLQKKNREFEKEEFLQVGKMRYLSCGKGADLESAKDMRIYNVTNWFAPLFDVIIGDYVKFIGRINQTRFIYSFLTLFVMLVRDLFVFGVLTYLYAKGELTAGNFAFYYTVIKAANSWIDQMASTYAGLYLVHLNTDDYRKCIEQPDDTHGTEELAATPSKCTVEFCDVSFSYDGVHNAVSHLSFKVVAGEKIAIVGENGAGKTTAMKLLSGLYFPTSGKILINGKDASNLKSSERSKLFSAIFQDVYIMPATVCANVTMHPNETVDKEKLDESLRLAGLSQKVDSLPDGVQTRLRKDIDNEDAVDFSGGETQKLLLARAIYKEAPIIILDEPTAALDPIAENALYLKYDEITSGRTSFYISHRLASTAFCDKILFLDKGEITETGTHKALMDAKGKYFKMYSMQSHYYNEENAGGERNEKTI